MKFLNLKNEGLLINVESIVAIDIDGIENGVTICFGDGQVARRITDKEDKEKILKFLNSVEQF